MQQEKLLANGTICNTPAPNPLTNADKYFFTLTRTIVSQFRFLIYKKATEPKKQTG